MREIEKRRKIFVLWKTRKIQEKRYWIKINQEKKKKKQEQKKQKQDDDEMEMKMNK